MRLWIWSKCIQFYHQKRDVYMQTERVYNLRFAVNPYNRVQSINSQMEFSCSFGFGILVSWFRPYVYDCSCNKIKPGSCLTSGCWYQLLAILSAKCSINHSFSHIFLHVNGEWTFEQRTEFRSWAEHEFFSLQTNFYNLKLILHLFHYYYHCRQSNLSPFIQV